MLTIEPAPFLQHGGQESLDGPVHRLDVEVEGKIPVVLGTIEHAALMHIARAVDQNVERAEFFRDLLRQRLDRFGRAHVELEPLDGVF